MAIYYVSIKAVILQDFVGEKMKLYRNDLLIQEGHLLVTGEVHKVQVKLNFYQYMLIYMKVQEGILVILTLAWCGHHTSKVSPIALRKAKIVYNFGLSECNRVKEKGKTL